MGPGKAHRLVDLTGRRFGRLVVVGRGENSSSGGPRWACRCDCGGSSLSGASALKAGMTQSCGCLRRERLEAVYARNSAEGTGHGLSKRPEYSIWAAMLNRCRNPRVRGYANYGGRGIKVCDRWASSFPAFFEDMGPRPGRGYEIDRKVNDGGYEPGNCRWATKLEQAINRRTNRRVEWNGETLTMREWSSRLGIPSATLRRRIDRGWTLERAFSETVDISRRNGRARPSR